MYSLNTCLSLFLHCPFIGLILAYITRGLYSRMLFLRRVGFIAIEVFPGVEPAYLLREQLIKRAQEF